jgi:hypothetical protein
LKITAVLADMGETAPSKTALLALVFERYAE